MQRFRWDRVTAGIAAVSAVLCVYSVRQVDPDFWGYLDAGRLFATNGLTTADPFAYTSAQSVWVTFEYGAELALWSAYNYGGTFGLVALKALLGGACLGCLYLGLRATETPAGVWLPLFLITASGVSRFFLFRPQLFTFACFAVFALILLRHVLRKPSPVWCLPLIMVVWVNTHGGFVAGLGAIGLAMCLDALDTVCTAGWSAHTIVRRTRPLWIALASCAAATVVNPFGPRVWAYVWTELTHGTNRRYINEWQPATFSNDPWSTWVLLILTASVLLVAAASWMFDGKSKQSRPGPPPIVWAASTLPVLAMAFLSVRHTPLAAIWTAPVIAMLADDVAADLAAQSMFRRTWFVVRGLAVVPVLLTAYVVVQAPSPRIRTDGFVLGRTHPCRAVEYLRAAGIQGHIYNPLWWGSYLTWHLYPSVQVAMDGRNISLFPDAMVQENLRFYTHPAAEVSSAIPLKYDTDLLLVPTNSPVMSRLRTDTRWRQVYADLDAALFTRTDRSGAPGVGAPPSPFSATCPTYFE